MQDLIAQFSAGWQVSLPSLQNTLLYLLLAFVLSKPLAWVYIYTHQGVSYSRSTVQSLILLCLIVTLVMLAIGDSLARAFGLFGALALIRFRTPVKDTRDTVFLFLSVAVGITIGTQNIALAVAGTAFALLVALYLFWVGFGERIHHDGVLRLRLSGATDGEDSLHGLLRHYCRSFTLLQVRDGANEGEVEYSYQLQLRDPELSPGLIADIRTIAGSADVSLLMQTAHEEI
jgi:hypothetical protein